MYFSGFLPSPFGTCSGSTKGRGLGYLEVSLAVAEAPGLWDDEVDWVSGVGVGAGVGMVTGRVVGGKGGSE